MITYAQAILMGLVQGVTELFPISSLAQAVILPTILGWDNLAQAQSQRESFLLAFLVGLHVATATALLIYFWSDWRPIIRGFLRTLGEGARERKAPANAWPGCWWSPRSLPGSPDWHSSTCSGSRSPSLCSQRYS